ncbi:acetate kinase-like protein [Ascodesmis nigricans]|uniref:Probable acetate kinase n=1 Tax=Ascodesmis nigricans TaxID=341454 RepID=A0A4S2N8C9_9PEZI|nr:acetate kinase-like protein [Ascodesmis nigricans]
MPAVLSVNAGSSSIKLSLYDTHYNDKSPTLILESSISNLTAPPAKFTYTHTDKNNTKHNISSKELPNDIADHSSAFSHFLHHLSTDPDLPNLNITHTVHRVVHGGNFPTSQPLSKSTIAEITSLTDLAPLHNSPALSLVHSTLDQLSESLNVAYFDTSFHATIPKAAQTYALSPDLAEKKGIRRYGFHGISYAYILRRVASYLSKPIDATSIIALHLGSGASIAAIKDGKSIDTSMGLTPLEGLPGATRSGLVDPSLVFHYTSKASNLSRESTKEMHISKAEMILNKEAGWKSMTGTTNFREVLKRAAEGDETCALAAEVFVDRIVGFMGSYWVKLGGEVDAIVFSGGIGEKSDELRLMVCEKLACLGVRLDERANRRAAENDNAVVAISSERVSDRESVKVLVCRTDEQHEMVWECVKDERYWKEVGGKTVKDVKMEEAK